MNKTYSVMVIGDNPQEQMEKFNKALKTSPYIKYKIDDATLLQEKAKQSIEMYIAESKGNPLMIEYLYKILTDIQNMTDVEHFAFLTKELEHNDNGDAIDNANPDGKWISYKLGNKQSIPLITHDGKETFQSLKKDIDWTKTHLANSHIYQRTWEIIIEGSEPQNDTEKQILSLMSEQKNYLANFKTKDNYIKYNASYWNYAVIKNGVWIDVDNKSSFNWIVDFYNTFVEPLNNNELITIYEYQIENENG